MTKIEDILQMKMKPKEKQIMLVNNGVRAIKAIGRE